jgi:hypothetical protein
MLRPLTFFFCVSIDNPLPPLSHTRTEHSLRVDRFRQMNHDSAYYSAYGRSQHTAAVNTETFLPPAFTQLSDASRPSKEDDKIVCAIAPDIHFEIKVRTGKTHKFNPRMHGPATPKLYTGRTAPEAEQLALADDPVELGVRVAHSESIDGPMYDKYDPRKLTNTVVVRDYLPKTPLAPGDDKAVAAAVLGQYTDSYVTYLNTFVRVLFGNGMQSHLDTLIKGYKKILSCDEELNRIAWGAYMAVQGGIDPGSCGGGDGNVDCDVTLAWSDHIKQQMQKIDGTSAMTGKLPSVDVYDLRPCLEQHVATLTEMKNEWCKGFGTSEENAVALMLYAQEQGRNLMDDYRLMAHKGTPDYEAVKLLVPKDVYAMWETSTGKIDEPEMDATIRKDLRLPAQTVYATKAYAYPVGSWSGSTPGKIFALNCRADYKWGLGHPMNVQVQRGSGSQNPTIGQDTYPMYLKHSRSGEIMGTETTAYVTKERWGDAMLKGNQAAFTAIDTLTQEDSQPVSLRDTMLGIPPKEKERVVSRGASGYRAVAKLPSVNYDDPRHTIPERPSFEWRSYYDCSSKYTFSILDPDLVPNGTYFDPFLKNIQCIDVSQGDYRFSVDMLKPYSFGDYKNSPIARGLVSVYYNHAHKQSNFLGDDHMETKLEWAKNTMKDYNHNSTSWQYATLNVGYGRKGSLEYKKPPPWVNNAPVLMNVVDMNGVAFTSPDTNMAMDGVLGNNQQRVALQMVFLRKVLQYSMGMDLALCICAQPFPNFDQETINSYPETFCQALNDGFKSVGMSKKYQWKWERNEVQLFTVGVAGAVEPGQTRYLTMKASLAIMLARLNALLGGKTTAQTREVFVRGALFVQTYMKNAGSNQDGGMSKDMEVPMARQLPTELLYQFVDMGDCDPRLVFAGTVDSYNQQVQDSPMNQPFPTQGTHPSAIHPDGYPTNINSTVMEQKMHVFKVDKYVTEMKKRFDAACERPGLRPFLERLTQFNEYRGPSGIDLNEPMDTPPSRRMSPSTRHRFDAVQWPRADVSPAQRSNIADDFDRKPAKNDLKNFAFAPLGHYTTNERQYKDFIGTQMYNRDLNRPQLFTMLDAAALLWNARAYFNPADAHRPDKGKSDECTPDDMHYWCRLYVETFLLARERQKGTRGSLYEVEIKNNPQEAMPSELIGALCERTRKTLFPLLPTRHALFDKIRKFRALSCTWGMMPCNNSWMPLSQAHHVKLLQMGDLWDKVRMVPLNAWTDEFHEVYNQSYHSFYDLDDPKVRFQDWVEQACRYQPPRDDDKRNRHYPFSQYGGSVVTADFLPHRVEKPAAELHVQRRHSQLVFERFGITTPLRIGRVYKDTGLLQDMFQYEYRPTADISDDQKAAMQALGGSAQAVYISNFMAYARTHAIIAMASDGGKEQMIVRNLFRLYTDTYRCVGVSPGRGVPAIMGFATSNDLQRPITIYAGNLATVNSKVSAYCAKHDKEFPMYKRVFLNDATLIYMNMLRGVMTDKVHDRDFTKAKYHPENRGMTRADYDKKLIALQDVYIDFLRTALIAMTIKDNPRVSMATLKKLVPCELSVAEDEVTEDLVATDFLAQKHKGKCEGLTRRQLAQLSLKSPNQRVMGTLRIHDQTSSSEIEQARKQLVKPLLEDVAAADVGFRLLARDGTTIDKSFDVMELQENVVAVAPDPTSVSLQDQQRFNRAARKLKTGFRGDAPVAVSELSDHEYRDALEAIRNRVEREYTYAGGAKSHIECLRKLDFVPDNIKHLLAREYAEDA